MLMLKYLVCCNTPIHRSHYNHFCVLVRSFRTAESCPCFSNSTTGLRPVEGSRRSAVCTWLTSPGVWYDRLGGVLPDLVGDLAETSLPLRSAVGAWYDIHSTYMLACIWRIPANWCLTF